MAITLFSTLGGLVETAVASATQGLQSEYVSALTALATAGGTLYVLFYGYSVIAGKIDSPLSDFVWNISRMFLIMMFVNNVGGLLDAASEAVRGLQAFAADGKNEWALLDIRATNIANLVNQIWSDHGGISGKIAAALEIGALFPLFLGVAAIAKELAFSTISLTILITVMPIFIFCLMYGFLKQMFSKFLTLVLVNFFKILFISVLSNVAFKLLAATTENAKDLTAFSTIAIYLLGGLLCLSVASLAGELANALAETSIENTVAGKLGAAANSANNMGRNAAGITGQLAKNTDRELLGGTGAKVAGKIASGSNAVSKSAMTVAQATPIGRVGVGVAKAVVGTVKGAKKAS